MKRNLKREKKDVKSYTDLADLKNIHEGRRCFILGAGPSTAFLNLEGINNDVVITVNSSILLVDWSKGQSTDRYWISNDTLCLQWDYFWRDVLKSNSTKIVRTSWKEHADKILPYNFRFFEPRKTIETPLANDGKALSCVSSIPTAIDFALLTGCKEIYMVGVDHRMVHGNSHFWQFWPKQKWPQRKSKGKDFRPEQSHQIKKFEENVATYKSLKELADSLGSVVYNCSQLSVIDVFEKRPLPI